MVFAVQKLRNEIITSDVFWVESRDNFHILIVIEEDKSCGKKDALYVILGTKHPCLKPAT